MIGRTLGHYRVLEKLGEGGMGEVYRAEDATLDRQVALKVLPPDLASSQERLDRFQREASTFSRGGRWRASRRRDRSIAPRHMSEPKECDSDDRTD